MADDKTFTKAELDAAVEKAAKAVTDKLQESIDALEAKNTDLVGEVRKAKQAARSEVKVEDLHAAEEARDKAQADLAEAQKQVKTLTSERDKAVKSLETEQGAARSYALDAELNTAIATGGVVPALVPALTAMLKQGAKADLVDGKYAVTFGDKPLKDHVAAFLGSEEGKHFKAASVNGGGGAGGGGDKSGGTKQITRTEFDAMPPADKVAFGKEGGNVVDAVA